VSLANENQVDFGSLVAFYERIVDPLTLPMGRRALDLISLSAGDALIDVAAGTGALAVEAAERGAKVLAIDLEPKMVARATARLGPYAGCEAAVMNFEALDVPDASFDAAISIAGVLSFATGEDGMAEMVRVTRPGGRVAVATWDQEDAAAPQYLAREVFARTFPGRELWPEGFFPAWTRDAVARALRALGCDDIRTAGVEGVWTVETPGKVMTESGQSIRMFPGYRALGDADRSRFDEAFTAAVAGQAGADGMAHIATRAFVVAGRVAPG